MRPLARIFTPAPLDPKYSNGFSARWFHFAKALGEHCEIDVVAVRGIWDEGDLPAQTFRPPLSLHSFSVLDAIRILEPPPSRLQRAAMALRDALDASRLGPDIPGIDRFIQEAPDLAIFFLHHMAHLAFRLPADVPCLFVLEEPVIRLELDNRPREVTDLLHKLWRSLLFKLAVHRYGRFVARCGRRGQVVTISAEEKLWFSHWIQPQRITVIPHGIDLEEFRPLPPVADHDVGIFGDLGQPRNYLPVISLIKRARQQPQTRTLRWLLVGRDPDPSLRALADERVTVTGTVPGTQAYYPRVRVVIVPARTVAGAKTTLLQAWAMERPVVTTPMGIRGLPARHGENVLVADDDDQILEAVQRLLSEPALTSRMAAAGRQTLIQDCSLPAQAQAFADLCAKALSPEPAGP